MMSRSIPVKRVSKPEQVISRELIFANLEGQALVVRVCTGRDVADAISQFRLDLAGADTFERIRLIESQAARVYRSAWGDIPILYPREDIARIPEHWKTFSQRVRDARIRGTGAS